MAAKKTTLNELGKMVGHVVKSIADLATKEDIKDMPTKDDVREVVREELKPIETPCSRRRQSRRH